MEAARTDTLRGAAHGHREACHARHPRTQAFLHGRRPTCFMTRSSSPTSDWKALGRGWSVAGNWMYTWFKNTGATATTASTAGTLRCARQFGTK